MKKIIVMIIMALFVIAITFLSCSKPKNSDQPIKKTYTVTFTFENTAPCYFVSISDITNLNDFSDSIKQSLFTKTIIYDYKATYRCDIINSNNKASTKKVKITYDTITNTCEDSMYASLNCWLVID